MASWPGICSKAASPTFLELVYGHWPRKQGLALLMNFHFIFFFLVFAQTKLFLRWNSVLLKVHRQFAFPHVLVLIRAQFAFFYRLKKSSMGLRVSHSLLSWEVHFLKYVNKILFGHLKKTCWKAVAVCLPFLVREHVFKAAVHLVIKRLTPSQIAQQPGSTTFWSDSKQVICLLWDSVSSFCRIKPIYTDHND